MDKVEFNIAENVNMILHKNCSARFLYSEKCYFMCESCIEIVLFIHIYI